MRTLQTEGRKLKFSKERSRTGKSEEDDLLVGPLLGGVVVDGDTARGDLAGLLRPGDVTVVLVSWRDAIEFSVDNLREHDVLGEGVTSVETLSHFD
jgi:hypothetical protein